MGQIRNWTPEEEDYLKGAWGVHSVDSICKHLNRSKTAVIVRAQRLHLGAFTDCADDYITFNQLLNVCLKDRKGASSYTFYLEKWQRLGLKVKEKKTIKCRIRTVKLKDFWKWAGEHRDQIDLSRFEKYALGPEPKWADEQRRLDTLHNIDNRTQSKWTASELDLLNHLMCKGGYDIPYIAKRLNRTEGSVARKIYDLGYDTPKKAQCKHYSETELQLVTDEIIKGNHYREIARMLGRSEKSIRGMIFQRFNTEAIGKVRTMLLNGEKLEVKERYPHKQLHPESTEASGMPSGILKSL